jgi:hypothetical protein
MACHNLPPNMIVILFIDVQELVSSQAVGIQYNRKRISGELLKRMFTDNGRFYELSDRP